MDGIVTAAVKGDLVAVELRTRLGGNVNDSGRAVAKLGRQVPVISVTELIRCGSISCPKPLRLSGSETPLMPVLHVAVIAADMDFPEFLLHHARRVQQHLLKGGVFTLAHGLNLVRADFVSDRPQAGRDLLARRVQVPGYNHRAKLRRKIRRVSNGVGRGRTA